MPTLSEIHNMQVGIWNYGAGTEGSIDTSTLVDNSDIANMDEVRILTITVIAKGVDGYVQVDNRPTITVPAGASLTLEPRGTLINPILGFTDTASYVFEYVTNNIQGSSRGSV